jgi:hypothetical protein
MPWSFGADWHDVEPVFLDGNWWYDEHDNTFGYRLGGDERREWADTTWDFPGPEQYPDLAAEQQPGWTAKAGEKAMHEALVSGDPHAIDLAAGQHRSTARPQTRWPACSRSTPGGRMQGTCSIERSRLATSQRTIRSSAAICRVPASWSRLLPASSCPCR